MAERTGFEPAEGLMPSADFESAAFNRSATSPVMNCKQFVMKINYIFSVLKYFQAL